MTVLNKRCPICGVELGEHNISRKYWLKSKPIRVDAAGRALCQKCAEWIDNTEWD